MSTMTVIIEIDQNECTGCGLCYNDECPEVFQEGEDGTTEIVEEYQNGGPTKGKVSDDLLECIEQAVNSCPVTAITLTKE
jgi:ferredoxin